MSNLNFTIEDGNDGTKYPETIPSILLCASCLTEHEVWRSGRFGRTKAGAIRIEKVCQWICRAAEKLDMVRMFKQTELTNFRMYSSKVRACGNICTIKRWGERRKVRIFPMKYAMPNNGGIGLTGLEEAPKSRKNS
ncbi:hypothetical protein [Paenibacillus ferrarius]|nr:hypothetical protein [Paenibacillus ferrarius]